MNGMENTRVVIVDGCRLPFDVAISQMDDELREQVQAKGDVKTDQELVDAYARAHERKFGEPFALQ